MYREGQCHVLVLVRVEQVLRREAAVYAAGGVHGGNEEAANEDGVDAEGGGRVVGGDAVQGMQGQRGAGHHEGNTVQRRL